MKKILCGLLSVVMLLLLCGCTPTMPSGEVSSKVVYQDTVPENRVYKKDSTGTDSIKLFLYHQYGFEMYLDSKTISGEAAEVVCGLLQGLSETCERGAAISEEEVDLEYEYGISLPVDAGTMWVKTEEALYRIDTSDSRICRVDTPLGEGVILDYTQACKQEINMLWSYWPYDCWNGVYENGILNMSHKYAVESNLTVMVKDIMIKKEEDVLKAENSIILELVSETEQRVDVWLEPYQSDDVISLGDSERIEMKAGEKKEITLNFGGFSGEDYWIVILANDVRIKININLEE